MASNTVYVIAGASRGIGLGLVKAYLSRPSTTVVGFVRNENSAAVLQEAIKNVEKGTGSILYIGLVDFSKESNPDSIREIFLTATNNLNHVDTLICSVGHLTPMLPTISVTAEHLRECFELNTISPLVTFQALWPLMSNDPKEAPKFIVLSSSVGSIGDMEPVPGGAYGPSKAAVNYIIKSLHSQMAESSLISIALHPGWVQTAMGHQVAKEWNFSAGPPVTVDDSVKGIVKVIDEAKRDTTSGKFITQTGDELPW